MPHVLWPEGFGGRFDVAAALTTAAAIVALFRYRAGALPLLGACAMAGLVWSLLQPALAS